MFLFMGLLPLSMLGLGGRWYLMGSSGQWYLLGLSVLLIVTMESLNLRKNKGTTICDRRTVKFDIETAQCDNGTIKFEKQMKESLNVTK